MQRFLERFHPVKTAQRLFYLNAAIWFVIGLVTLIRYADGRGSDRTGTTLVIAVMMFGNVAAMLVSGWGLDKKQKWLYALALGIVVVNITLATTNAFGILGLITLSIALVLLGILIANRGHYL